MATLLHIDASARPGRSNIDAYGSHTRRLTRQFVDRWRAQRPEDAVIYRDVGSTPPSPVTGSWIHAAFTPAEQREPWMHEVLAESDALIDELLLADVLVLGVPMYNFNVPAPFKAYIDNIVRVGRSFGFDRKRSGAPYWPMLSHYGKRVALISSRGDFGYDPGERIAKMNHVEPSIRTALGYIGITDIHCIAAEYDEFRGDRLETSLAKASTEIDRLVDAMLSASAFPSAEKIL